MKQKLGQNFLIDKRVAQREVDFAEINSNDVVLEIGPGNGILTNIIAEKAKKVIAIEIDLNLIYELKYTVSENVEVIHEDALKIDFKSLPKFNKIVSNLPFQISSPITFKFLDYAFECAILIYQKEFADRMVAEVGTKDYSRLTVGAYYKTKCELLETISKNCFKPKPKVDSAMIRLVPRKKPPFKINSEKFFYELTKNLFNHRRKKIRSTLKQYYSITSKDIPYLDDRVESLTPEQIGKMSNILSDLLGL